MFLTNILIFFLLLILFLFFCNNYISLLKKLPSLILKIYFLNDYIFFFILFFILFFIFFYIFFYIFKRANVFLFFSNKKYNQSKIFLNNVKTNNYYFKRTMSTVSLLNNKKYNKENKEKNYRKLPPFSMYKTVELTEYSLIQRIIKTINNQIFRYPVPISLNNSYTFGSVSFVFLLIQIISGVFLSIYYIPDTNFAFDSIQYIMNDVNNGWYFRYMHAIGASFFFLVVYIHMGRSIYYSSYTYPRETLWITGVIIYILMMATAFLGYVLPWGQMSYWAATVITNLFTAIPYIGDDITHLIWGGESVGNATLKRFFILHVLLPFVILGFVFLHLIILHKVGPNTPLGVGGAKNVSFYPYFVLKDLSIIFFVLSFFFYCWSHPEWFIHCDNNMKANPMKTPKHIVPEWYFLPFYAMLRSIPNKIGGILVMLCAILILFFLPRLARFEVFKSPKFRPLWDIFFSLFIGAFIMLGWLGSKPITEGCLKMSQIFTFFYFFYFLFIIPVYTRLEHRIFIKGNSLHILFAINAKSRSSVEYELFDFLNEYKGNYRSYMNVEELELLKNKKLHTAFLIKEYKNNPMFRIFIEHYNKKYNESIYYHKEINKYYVSKGMPDRYKDV